jgi:SAM-dependent methyltransferase
MMDDYYEKQCTAYFERTVQIDPTPFLQPFADRLPAGATVLDVGCGSGRDLLWLKKRGFNATGFERSPGLAGLAAAHAGCPVRVGDFETFDFSSLSCDALLLCGSLVHLPPDELPVILDNILKSLNTPGWVFLSLKGGQGQRTDQGGRTFYLWQPETLEEVLEKRGLRILDFSRSVSAAGTGEPWLGYVLAFGQQAEGERYKAEG